MKFLLCLIFLAAGCGSDSDYSNPGPSRPPDKPPDSGLPVGFAKVKLVIDEQCASAGCHGGAAFTQNPVAFKDSSSRQRIISGSMPKNSGPNYDIYNSAKKKILLDFLSN